MSAGNTIRQSTRREALDTKLVVYKIYEFDVMLTAGNVRPFFTEFYGIAGTDYTGGEFSSSEKEVKNYLEETLRRIEPVLRATGNRWRQKLRRAGMWIKSRVEPVNDYHHERHWLEQDGIWIQPGVNLNGMLYEAMMGIKYQIVGEEPTMVCTSVKIVNKEENDFTRQRHIHELTDLVARYQTN